MLGIRSTGASFNGAPVVKPGRRGARRTRARRVASFNGAPVVQPGRRAPRASAGCSRDTRFNGAPVVQPGRPDAPAKTAPTMRRFNGAPVVQPGRRRYVRPSATEPGATLQWSPGRSTGETSPGGAVYRMNDLLQWSPGRSTGETTEKHKTDARVTGASMEPRSFNRGDPSRVGCWSARCSGFNGAPVVQPGRPRACPSTTGCGSACFNGAPVVQPGRPRRRPRSVRPTTCALQWSPGRSTGET